MSRYKNEQRRVAHRGRRFHFISYEAQGADLKRQQVAMPAMWYLESSGRRWPAIPQTMEQPEAELEAQLIVWLEGYAFAPSPPPAPAPDPPPQRFLRPEWTGGAPN
jgi:hypothetical protein